MKIESIGIIGQGKMGDVMCQILPRIFFDTKIIVSSRSNGIALDALSECDLIIPAVPTSVFEDVIQELGPILKSGSIVIDICSLKVYPSEAMEKILPDTIKLIASHPMFGPGTLKKTNGSLTNLKWVMYPVRCDQDTFQTITDSCKKQGIDIVEISPDIHDRYAAEFHFTAHIIAAILKDVGISRTPIDTRSAEYLFDFMEMVHTDSPSLLIDMMRYNPYCRRQLQKVNDSQKHVFSFLNSI